jgi:hypothetical protein
MKASQAIGKKKGPENPGLYFETLHEDRDQLRGFRFSGS